MKTDPCKTIIIEVRRGIADVTHKPAGVALIVRDFDCLEEGALKDKHGHSYEEQTYREDECV